MELFWFFVWKFIGVIVYLFLTVYTPVDGFELVNPYHVYKYHKRLNWFGAIIVSVFYTALCPVGTVCYWFYKLCTVGRK